jgi:hypothetical protein
VNSALVALILPPHGRFFSPHSLPSSADRRPAGRVSVRRHIGDESIPIVSTPSGRVFITICRLISFRGYP